MSSTNTPNAGDGDQADKAAKADKAKAAMTAEQAAKLVKRPALVPAEKEGGQPAVKMVPVKPAEVLSFKDYGSHVVVVTKDGQKFSSADAEAA